MTAVAVVFVVVGAVLLFGGGAWSFAYMMSDNPIETNNDSTRSCIVALAGLLLIVCGVVGVAGHHL